MLSALSIVMHAKNKPEIMQRKIMKQIYDEPPAAGRRTQCALLGSNLTELLYLLFCYFPFMYFVKQVLVFIVGCCAK